jgi:hypothetical protein
MNVAHEVVVVSRSHTAQALTLEPQSVDPSNLLRPAALLLNTKNTDFEFAAVEKNDSGKLIMKPLTGRCFWLN